MMTNQEKGALIRLFNRDGYVLDISTSDFDALTMDAVGVPLTATYHLSKGKSLIAYTDNANDEDICNLFNELMKYYETEYSQFESETKISDPLFGEKADVGCYYKEYLKCKSILQKYTQVDANRKIAEKTVEIFSTDYLNQQIKLMLEMQDNHPSEALGKAKELIESCCRTILLESNAQYDKTWNIDRLAKETFEIIHLMPKDISDSSKEAECLKQILGNLRAIVKHVAEIRNAYGSGHGREANFKGLESRHARLIVGMSISLVNFLWASYERNTNQPLF